MPAQSSFGECVHGCVCMHVLEQQRMVPRICPRQAYLPYTSWFGRPSGIRSRFWAAVRRSTRGSCTSQTRISARSALCQSVSPPLSDRPECSVHLVKGGADGPMFWVRVAAAPKSCAWGSPIRAEQRTDTVYLYSKRPKQTTCNALMMKWANGYSYS